MEDYIAAFYENVYIYLEIKSQTLSIVRYLVVEFCNHECESIGYNFILYALYPQISETKNHPQHHIFSIFLLHINTQFTFSA